jgi:hypothetical protein
MCLSVSTLSIAQDEIKFPSGREKHDNKPQHFSHLSSKLSVTTAFVSDVFNSKINDQLNLTIADGFLFKGQLINKTNEGQGVETVTIESKEKKGLLLTVTRFTKPDGSIELMGAVLSREISDMFQMEKDLVSGNYFWVRKNVSQLISD